MHKLSQIFGDANVQDFLFKAMMQLIFFKYFM